MKIHELLNISHGTAGLKRKEMPRSGGCICYAALFVSTDEY